jgi:hypothetical protein
MKKISLESPEGGSEASGRSAEATFWPVALGEALNRWHVSAAETEYFPGVARPMPDAIDYRFINGWVATGDLPCREALRERLLTRDIRLPSSIALSNIYLGGEDPRVDFSTFCFRPLLVRRWMRCIVSVETAQTVRFAAETCGGLHVWVNEAKVLAHEPYDRNIAHSATFSADLPQGDSILTVFLEDLHERDTSCFFKLTLLDGKGVNAGIEAEIDSHSMREVEATLNGLRTERLFYDKGTVRVIADYLPDRPVDIELAPGWHPSETVTMNVLPDGVAKAAKPIRFTISKDSPAADLFDIDGLRAACISLTFVVEIGGARIERGLGTSILPPPLSLGQSHVAERKRAALDVMAASGKDEPSRALVLLALGKDPEQATRLVESALPSVIERHDCADFWLLPLLWIYRKHAGTQLPDETWQRLRDVILNFRYWLDEPGNDVMWYWSENHVLCFHIAQYLAGDLFPDEIFPNSGKTGAQHRAQAEARLHRWFDAIDTHGLAEWNSAAYYPIDFLGLFTLLENAADPSLKERTAKLLDEIFVMTALHTLSSVPSGSQGRIYEKELFAGSATELASVAAIAFGGSWYAGHDRAAALFALSAYEPPREVSDLAFPAKGRRLTARYTQGLNMNAKLSLWKCADAQLSSVAEYKTGELGHQQHMADIQLAGHMLARFWINHPGDLKVWGGSRPSYWAGSGINPRVAQYDNVALMLFDLTRQHHPIRFTHVFVPVELCDEVIVETNWIFARVADGYVGIYGSSALEALEQSLFAGMEWRMHAEKAGWLLIAGSAETHGEFSAFRESCLALAPHFDAEKVSLTLDHPEGMLRLPFEGELQRGGTPLPFSPLSTVPQIGIDGGALHPWTDIKEFSA